MPDADTQVRLVEPVWDVPAKGTKLPSLLDQSMEETQAKEQFLPYLGRGGGGRKRVGGRERENEGGRERTKERGREGERERRERRKERGREGEREKEGERQGGREERKEMCMYI